MQIGKEQNNTRYIRGRYYITAINNNSKKTTYINYNDIKSEKDGTNVASKIRKETSFLMPSKKAPPAYRYLHLF